MQNSTSEQTSNDVIESAKRAGLISCEYCMKLNHDKLAICRCCGAKLHSRIHQSINRCWALTISAILLLIPANILPIMTVKTFGQGEPDTIISGIISLFQHGLYPIGVIVFLASIMVPILKIIGLVLLLLSLEGKITMGRNERTRVLRWVEFFGKWSMLDVFVVSFLVALVNIGDIANVNAGLGITAFCATVILTIFAANSFDSRLIWDQLHDERRITSES
ncbi:MAG: paraquat-inducible membrane protein A [Gammaproteobacteria bacterium]|nr:MAG: paraquat-inducible membrane protein A [Gammaproteobacteria bacterium]